MRGEIWVARAELYATKVRPALVVQSDDHDAYDSTVTCLFTGFESDNDIARVRIEPDSQNCLNATSFVMTDKIFSFDKNDLDKRIGHLSDKEGCVPLYCECFCRIFCEQLLRYFGAHPVGAEVGDEILYHVVQPYLAAVSSEPFARDIQ